MRIEYGPSSKLLVTRSKIADGSWLLSVWAAMSSSVDRLSTVSQSPRPTVLRTSRSIESSAWLTSYRSYPSTSSSISDDEDVLITKSLSPFKATGLGGLVK